MATVERSGSIAASPDQVWSVLSDFAAISAWAPNVDHSCLMSEQRDGVGMVRRIQIDRVTVVETVETWEPGRTLAYCIGGLPPVIKSVTNTWSITAADDDHVDVRLTTEVDAGPRPPQQLIAKAVGKKLAAASEQMIAGLTIHLEQGTTP